MTDFSVAWVGYSPVSARGCAGGPGRGAINCGVGAGSLSVSYCSSLEGQETTAWGPHGRRGLHWGEETVDQGGGAGPGLLLSTEAMLAPLPLPGLRASLMRHVFQGWPGPAASSCPLPELEERDVNLGSWAPGLQASAPPH